MRHTAWSAFSGRYTRVEDERTLPRTVYDLHAPSRVDPWELVHRYRAWVPWLDALYGSATYLPMADGALYEIKVSQSGLRRAAAQSGGPRSGRQLALRIGVNTPDTHRKNSRARRSPYC